MAVNLDAGPTMSGPTLWHHLARPAGYLLSPLLLAQGRRARSRRGRLPNAPLPWSGTIGGSTPVRLVGLGDSTIAGVGVNDSMLGLTAQFAKALYEKTKRGVTWDSFGQRGITTGQLRDGYLPQSLPDVSGADIVLVSIGANDAKSLRSASAATTDILAIIDTIHDHNPEALVVVSSLPAFQLFQPLPQPLRSIMAGHAQAIERRARPLVESRRFALMSPPPPSYPRGFFASDGFHPSAQGYRIWAEFALSDVARRGGLAHLGHR